MKKSNAEDDLAYVRAIAEEGRNVPLVSGSSFIVWGGIIGTTALIQFFMSLGVLPSVNMIALWSTAFVLGWTVGTVVSNRSNQAPGASSVGNRIVGAVWSACGIFISLYWLSLVAAYFLYRGDLAPVGFLFATMFPVAFGIYGVAFYVTAIAANQSWYKWVSVGSWTISVILILTLMTDMMLLLSALGTYAVVLAPGLIMLKDQPSDIV
ncbi:hypothetical protein [Parvularcula sp. IMCC14364]|uniref:hypothetical protein n=1 Tax=Parvularcula sp. IMCC14364 TaxID=3067902 RepID=UPI002740B332|nr:hypothetical protein [Parvularcula sp. IMCC14364]